MSNLSCKANASTSDTKNVQEPSSTMAAKALPAGEEAASDENAPSTSQGRQHQSSHQQRQVGAASCSSSNSSSNDNSNDTNHSQNRGCPSSATPMTQLNGPVMRIKRELNEIVQHPPPNCSAEMYKEDLFHWKAIIMGPSGTPYEGGTFKLDIRFPGAYPFRPPQIRFITRIYHCNVDSRGVICLDVLNERWSPVMNIAKVLLSIWVLIGECNPNDPLVMGIADQYKCNRKEHDKVARYWTKRFAMPKTKPSSKLEQELMLSNAQEQDKSEQVSDQVSDQSSEPMSEQLSEQMSEQSSTELELEPEQEQEQTLDLTAEQCPIQSPILNRTLDQEQALEMTAEQRPSQSPNLNRAQDQEQEKTASSGTSAVNHSRSKL